MALGGLVTQVRILSTPVTERDCTDPWSSFEFFTKMCPTSEVCGDSPQVQRSFLLKVGLGQGDLRTVQPKPSRHLSGAKGNSSEGDLPSRSKPGARLDSKENSPEPKKLAPGQEAERDFPQLGNLVLDYKLQRSQESFLCSEPKPCGKKGLSLL